MRIPFFPWFCNCWDNLLHWFIVLLWHHFFRMCWSLWYFYNRLVILLQRNLQLPHRCKERSYQFKGNNQMSSLSRLLTRWRTLTHMLSSVSRGQTSVTKVQDLRGQPRLRRKKRSNESQNLDLVGKLFINFVLYDVLPD